jgi:hypothetical protein
MNERPPFNLSPNNEGLGVVYHLLSKSDDNNVKSANGGFNHYSE